MFANMFQAVRNKLQRRDDHETYRLKRGAKDAARWDGTNAEEIKRIANSFNGVGTIQDDGLIFISPSFCGPTELPRDWFILASDDGLFVLDEKFAKTKGALGECIEIVGEHPWMIERREKEEFVERPTGVTKEQLATGWF
jgi:hypothetical protein